TRDKTVGVRLDFEFGEDVVQHPPLGAGEGSLGGRDAAHAAGLLVDLEAVVVDDGGPAAVVGEPAKRAGRDAEVGREVLGVVDDRQPAVGQGEDRAGGVLQTGAVAGADVDDVVLAEGVVGGAALLLLGGAAGLVLGAALLALQPAALALLGEGLLRVL